MLVLLSAIVAFGPLTADLYLPSLPSMKRALHADTSLVQLTLSLYLVGFACAQLVLGPLSDRFGRRPVLLCGIALYIIASLGCTLAPDIEALIAVRFVQALGACSGAVLGRAIVRDLYDRSRAASMLAYIGMVMAIAPAIAPFFGGILEVTFGWRSNFVAMAAFGTAVGVAVWTMLAETNRFPDRDALKLGRLVVNYGRLLRNTAYLAYVAIVAASFGGLFSWISGSAFVLIETFRIAPDRFGYYFMVVVVGFMVGSYVSGRLATRIGLDGLLLVGVSVQAVAGLSIMAFVLAEVGGAIAVVGSAALYFAGCGLTLPNGLAAALTPFPRMAGAASALVGFTQMLAGGLAGYLVGRFFDGTPLSLAALIAACGTLSLAVFALTVRVRRAALKTAGEVAPRA
jgi:DHA1 family bicyclomycin/chloramphenicol resistance-like MFS transporter